MTDSIIFMLEIIDMVLVMATVLGAVYIKIFVVNELDLLKKNVGYLAAENEQLKAKQKVYEKRLIKMATPEHIVITHESMPSDDAPKFGGF